MGNLPDDALDPPGIPRVMVYLSHEDFGNAALRGHVEKVAANGCGPLRAPHKVAFFHEAKLDPGEATVFTDIIFGLGPKRTKNLAEGVRAAVSAWRRTDAAKAEPTAASLLARVSGKRP